MRAARAHLNPARLDAPDGALPATGSSLVASLVVWHEVVR